MSFDMTRGKPAGLNRPVPAGRRRLAPRGSLPGHQLPEDPDEKACSAEYSILKIGI